MRISSITAAIILIGICIFPDAGKARDSIEPSVADTADYTRAALFLDWKLNEKIKGGSVSPNWIDGDNFWYRNRTAAGHEFIIVEADKQIRRSAFDHGRLASALSDILENEYEPYKLPFTRIDFRGEGDTLTFSIDGTEWECGLSKYDCRRVPECKTRKKDSVTSPDGRRDAYIDSHNLWVYERDTGRHIQLTNDGEEYYGYATDSQGWTRGASPILLWSPDSRMIATYKLDERGVGKMNLIETKEGRPVLHSFTYALPGDTVVPLHERVVIHVDGPRTVYLAADPDHQRTSSCCGLTREGVWTDVEWSSDSRHLAFVSTSRDYKVVNLRIADPFTGAVRGVYEERAETFFESNLDSRGIPNWRVLHDRGEFIWFTRKSGWGHLYLHELESGIQKHAITSGEWNVLDILGVDSEEGWIYFTAVGREKGRDPYYRHLYRVSFKGNQLTLLSPENADHQISISPSGRFFTDTYSSFNSPPVSIIRGPEGGRVMEVEKADVSELYETGWKPPVPFSVKGADRDTDLYGVMWLPSDFDPARKYPVINSIYPGPQIGSVGRRSFSVSGRGQTKALAELGFVVVQIDAGGSPLRSKAFHTSWYGNMGDNGLEDQIAATRNLADKYEWIDLGRSGIYGHSGGGYAAAGAMLRYPEFYHVGVASAGNHDNRGYTYYWGEKYQGLLEKAGDGSDTYENQANHTLAENLKGKLLISYGTMDSNVHPNMTLLLINELIKHNRDFDLMVFPNRGHGYFNEPYNIRITWDYFVRNLLGKAAPPAYLIER